MPYALNGPYTGVYVDGSTQVRHGYTTYWPQTSGVYPTIAFIHGGGGDSGDMAYHVAECARIAAIGRVAFSINYLLSTSGAGAFPGAVDDVHAFVSWAKATPGCVNDNKIVLCGYSHGGYLALLYAAMHPGQVAGAIAISAQDIDSHPAFCDADIEQFMGCTRAENPALWSQATPINYVVGQNGIDAVTFPPVLLIAGEADPIVYADTAFDLATALRSVETPATVFSHRIGAHGLYVNDVPLPVRDAVIDEFMAAI